MSKLSINERYSGINIDTCFDSKLNILVGNSGTGKTLLISAIDLHCLNNNIKCRLCNYNDANLSKQQLIAVCSESDVLLLDNSDLYIDNELLEKLLSMSKIIIMSIKDTSSISTGESEQYLVEYSNMDLTVRKI